MDKDTIARVTANILPAFFSQLPADHMSVFSWDDQRTPVAIEHGAAGRGCETADQHCPNSRTLFQRHDVDFFS